MVYYGVHLLNGLYKHIDLVQRLLFVKCELISELAAGFFWCSYSSLHSDNDIAVRHIFRESGMIMDFIWRST